MSSISNPRPAERPIELSQAYPEVPLASTEVTGVTMDSREVRPGDLYLAVPGQRVDGAQYASQAVAAGAVAVVCQAGAEDQLRAQLEVPVWPVPDVRAAAGQIAAGIYGQPATAMTTVGITGTNGKTTMSYLLDSVFQADGQVTGVLGTTGHWVAGKSIPTVHTTPEAPVVQALLAVMRDAGVTAAVMEVSSHALEFGRVGGITFDAAVFTNLSQDHLDFHGTMENYFLAKATLFDHTRVKVICIDDTWGQRLAAKHPDAITYAARTRAQADPADTSPATAASAHWRATHWQPDGVGSLCTVIDPKGRQWQLHVPLPGAFNVANALGALATADALGVPVTTAIAGIERCPGVPGRMQAVANDRAVRAYVDYAHTPDAVARAISAAPSPAVVVLGCGGDRDEAKRPLMGEAAARLAQLLVITDDNPRSEDPAAIRAAMIEGAHNVPVADRAEVVEIGDRRAAIEYAASRVTPGHTLLVLGKGHEQGQQVGDHVLPFDDSHVVAEALRGSL